MKTRLLAFGAALTLLISTGCGMIGAELSKLEQAWVGVGGTMTTYTQQGALVDEVHGESWRITRDERFDTESTSSGDGGTISNKDSEVLMISLANGHISHVGSTLVLAEDGITAVAGGTTNIRFTNLQPGTPWLNDLIERYRNLWQGKSKTIMIRSQDGTPIAVYAANQVEVFATDVPKSTWFRLDGQYELVVYRADMTWYDNHLIGPA
jgi:hypothetical protein